MRSRGQGRRGDKGTRGIFYLLPSALCPLPSAFCPLPSAFCLGAFPYI